MINKDRIVPITRTDLLSFFVTILRAAGNTLITLPVVDGVAIIPDGATGICVVDEPVKKIEGTISGDNNALFFCPAYDFEMTMTPVEGYDEFVANPGEIYGLNGTTAIEFSTGATYTVGTEDSGSDEGGSEGGDESNPGD